MMKNAYFMLKAVLFLRYLHFCCDVLVMQKNRLMSQIGRQIITTYISPNISRSKGNQAVKFGQLIKYVRNIFYKAL